MGIPNARLSFTFRDSEGDESVMNLYSEQDLDVLVPLLPDIKDILQGVSDAIVVRLDVTRLDPNPVDTNPVATNVDNEIQAKFGIRTTDATVMIVGVPAFDRTKLLPNGNGVDLTDPAVAEFVDMLLANDPLGTRIVDFRAADTASVKYALEAYAGQIGR